MTGVQTCALPIFACILAISNPIFRWESCKGSVSESVKKCSRLCKEAGTCDWFLRVAHGLQVARKLHMCQACQKLKSRASCCTIGQNSQAGQAVCLPLRGRRKGFTPRASVSSLIIHRVLSLCLHLSSLNLFHLISIVDVILIGLDCLSILF